MGRVFLVSVGDANDRNTLEIRKLVKRTNRNSGCREFLAAAIVEVVDVDVFPAYQKLAVLNEGRPVCPRRPVTQSERNRQLFIDHSVRGAN